MHDNCPICKNKLGNFNKTKIKDGVVICVNCMSSAPFKDRMLKGNKGFSIDEIRQYVEKKETTTKTEDNIGTTKSSKDKQKKQKWLTWVIVAILIIWMIGSMSDDDDETKTELIKVETVLSNQSEVNFY